MRANGGVFDKKISGCKIGFKFLNKLAFFFLLNIGDGISNKISTEVEFRKINHFGRYAEKIRSVKVIILLRL